MSVLEPIHVVALVKVTVVPLSNSLPVWVALEEIADVNFVFLKPELTEAFHSPINPVSDVSFEESLDALVISLLLRPDFLTVAVRLAFFYLTDVNGAIWVDQLTVTCCLMLVR
jgi:hypothetical protein